MAPNVSRLARRLLLGLVLAALVTQTALAASMPTAPRSAPQMTAVAAFHITGKVTHSGGTPVAGIDVNAIDASQSVQAFTNTASDGTYSLDVLAGTYTILFADGTNTYLNGYYSTGGFTIDPNAASPVSVTSASVGGINVQLIVAHHITGAVTRPGGNPVAGIEVYAIGTAYSAIDFTAGDGTYQLGVPSGTFSIFFFDPNETYLAGYYSAGGFTVDPAAATPLTISSGNVSGINVEIPFGDTYHALAPARILDSRFAIGVTGPFSAHVPQTFAVTGQGGVPTNATAVTGNVTVTGQTRAGYLELGPDPLIDPTSSTLNFPLGDTRANGVTVALGAGNGPAGASAERPASEVGDLGTLSATYVAPAGATAQVIFDVTGYFTPNMTGATYHPLAPTRILDSRFGIGLSGPFSNRLGRTFPVTGHGGVPSGATAVTGTLTVTGQTHAGYLFLGPVSMDNPTSSTLNFPLGDTRANGVTVALGAGGTLSATYVGASGTSAQVLFDVTGYFTANASGSAYHPISPGRILDTRSGIGLSGPFHHRVARTFSVFALGVIPANATALTGNLTVTGPTQPGYLFLGPVATNNPTSSTLNFPAADTRASGVTVALGAGGNLSATYVGVRGATAQVILDATGYFVAP